MWYLAAIPAIILLAALLYWALVITEGVFFSRRLVVWLYDRTAHQYDDIKQYNDYVEELFVARPLAHRLRHLPAPRVLDVATGTGRVPWYLLQVPTFNGRVTALDPADKMLRLAQTKLSGYRDRVGLVQQTAVPLPFSTNQFDAVTCLESLEFFPSTPSALAEMARVLKPGGLLLVTRRRGWEAKLFLRRHLSKTAFAALLASLGLVAIDIQPWQVEYDLVFAYKDHEPV